jgi:transcriptional regulator with XRE-family HTH domain
MASVSRTRDIQPRGPRHIARILEQRVEKLSMKELARKTGLDRNTIRRWRRGERIQPKTRLKLLKVAAGLNETRSIV